MCTAFYYDLTEAGGVTLRSFMLLEPDSNSDTDYQKLYGELDRVNGKLEWQREQIQGKQETGLHMRLMKYIFGRDRKFDKNIEEAQPHYTTVTDVILDDGSQGFEIAIQGKVLRIVTEKTNVIDVIPKTLFNVPNLNRAQLKG